MKRGSVICSILVATMIAALVGSVSAEPTVVVSATREASSRADIPASVTVVTAEEIAASGARNIDDALRAVPGVSVMRSIGMGQGMPTQIHMRGVPGDHRTLLMVDGVPLTEAATGYIGINEIPVSAVEQIEVVRGPFSHLYGTDAFAGVINIITESIGDEPESQVSAGYGVENLYNVSASTSGGKGVARYYVAGEHRSIDNYFARDYLIERTYDRSTQQYVETRKDTENADYADSKILGKVEFDLGDAVALTIHGRYFQGELGYGQKDMGALHPSVEDNITKTRTAIGGFSLTATPHEDTDVRIASYYRKQSRQLWGLDFSHFSGRMPTYVRSYLENSASEWQGEIGISHALNDSHTIAIGTDYKSTSADFLPLQDDGTRSPLPGAEGAEESIWNAALYLQDQVQLGSQVKVVAGVRVDYNSQFKEAVSPRAGLLYDVCDDTTLRLSIGRAFRAPTLVELYQPDLSFGYVTFQSNPDLKPEYIFSGDIELEHQFNDDITACLAVFYNEMKDLIENVSSGAVLSNVNIADAGSIGAELRLDWKISDAFAAMLSYLYQDAEDKSDGSSLDYIPESKGSLRLTAGTDFGAWRLEGSVTELYVGDRGFQDWNSGQWYDVADYWRTDLSVQGTYKDKCWIKASVQNVTDEKYQESRMFVLAPGRLASLEIGGAF